MFGICLNYGAIEEIEEIELFPEFIIIEGER